MNENPKWIGKLVFAIIGVSAMEMGDDHRQTQRDVAMLVERINMKYSDPVSGTPLIQFEERSERDISLPQRLAFFAAADVLMVTAPRLVT